AFTAGVTFLVARGLHERTLPAERDSPGVRPDAPALTDAAVSPDASALPDAAAPPDAAVSSDTAVSPDAVAPTFTEPPLASARPAPRATSAPKALESRRVPVIAKPGSTASVKPLSATSSTPHDPPPPSRPRTFCEIVHCPPEPKSSDKGR